MSLDTATLLVSCPDQQGLVAKIANFIYSNGGNIIHADHHTDLEAGLFLSRIEWQLQDFNLPKDLIGRAFNAIAQPLQADWQLHFSETIPKVAIWVSQQDHCLYDLLWRIQAKELKAKVGLIISNHEKLAKTAEQFGINFYYLPINKDNKKEQELKQLELLKNADIDLVILAKYMQVLSSDFLQEFPNVINIHHSFFTSIYWSKTLSSSL